MAATPQKTWITRFLRLTCIGGFFVVYYTSIVPWWISRSGICSVERRPWDMVEYLWAVWTSHDCAWVNFQTQFTLPALFVYSPFLIWLAIQVWADWEGRPPDWSVAMTGFGFGAIGAACVVFVSYKGAEWLFGGLWSSGMVGPGRPPTVLETIAIGLYVLIMSIIAPIVVWVKVYRANNALFKHLRGSGSAPLVYVGSMIGTGVGVCIGLAICGLVLLVMAIYAGFVALAFCATIAVVGVAVKSLT